MLGFTARISVAFVITRCEVDMSHTKDGYPQLFTRVRKREQKKQP